MTRKYLMFIKRLFNIYVALIIYLQ